MPSYEENKQIHNDLLIILKKFDDICRINGIKYSLHGGTLLGCIRESGFIPWDDDVDVSMTRSEFNKIKRVLGNSSELIIDEETNPFPQVWLKINDREPVWLDIFVWDYISENKLFQKFKIVIMCFFLAFLKTPKTMHLSTNSKKYTGIKHILIYFIYLLGRLFPNGIKHSWANWFEQRITGDHKYIHRSNDLYAGMKLILPSYVMDEYEDKVFEGETLMVSKYYQEILTSSYGLNYMTPVKMTGNEVITHALARKLH